MRCTVNRTRRLVGLISLLALVAIAVGVSGVELSIPRPGGGAADDRPALAGVRAVASTTLLRVGNGAPPGSDLAFLTVEPSGNLVVSDRARKKILRFDPTGHLLSEWGPQLGDFTLDEPAGVAVQSDAFYVLDRGVQRLIRLDTNGRVVSSFSLQPLGPYGLNGLAVDSYGLLYAADTGRNRILVFTPDGGLVKQFGRGGSGLGDFTQPMALAFSPDGTFTVTDWENSRLERFDASYAAIDEWSIGFRAFGVAADAQGRLYAPDNERRRIVAFSPRGDVLGELGGPGSVGIDIAPRQVAVAPGATGTLYALANDGIARLDLENTAPPVSTRGEIDVLGPLLFGMLLGLPILAVLLRRGRPRSKSVAAAPHRKVGLDAKNGAQRQHQQASTDQQLLVAYQAEREQQSADEHYQPVGDRQAHHSA